MNDLFVPETFLQNSLWCMLTCMPTSLTIFREIYTEYKVYTILGFCTRFLDINFSANIQFLYEPYSHE